METNWTNSQENQWIEKAVAGDVDAFNQLILTYQDMAFRLAVRILEDDASAADAVQVAFLSAYHGLKNFRSQTFRGWLLRIVRNACIDELRRRRRHPLLALEPYTEEGEEMESARWLVDPGLSPEEWVMQRETRARIDRCLRNLPEEMREVILLVDVEGLDYVEAAEALNVPLGTVKSRVARARARLQIALHEYKKEPEPRMNYQAAAAMACF
jgi:RNA polymerase sigma-70 factor, ECF subfamily